METETGHGICNKPLTDWGEGSWGPRVRCRDVFRLRGRRSVRQDRRPVARETARREISPRHPRICKPCPGINPGQRASLYHSRGSGDRSTSTTPRAGNPFRNACSHPRPGWSPRSGPYIRGLTPGSWLPPGQIPGQIIWFFWGGGLPFPISSHFAHKQGCTHVAVRVVSLCTVAVLSRVPHGHYGALG